MEFKVNNGEYTAPYDLHIQTTSQPTHEEMMIEQLKKINESLEEISKQIKVLLYYR